MASLQPPGLHLSLALSWSAPACGLQVAGSLVQGWCPVRRSLGGLLKLFFTSWHNTFTASLRDLNRLSNLKNMQQLNRKDQSRAGTGLVPCDVLRRFSGAKLSRTSEILAQSAIK